MTELFFLFRWRHLLLGHDWQWVMLEGDSHRSRLTLQCSMCQRPSVVVHDGSEVYIY